MARNVSGIGRYRALQLLLPTGYDKLFVGTEHSVLSNRNNRMLYIVLQYAVNYICASKSII
jgi:hypothetical protein